MAARWLVLCNVRVLDVSKLAPRNGQVLGVDIGAASAHHVGNGARIDVVVVGPVGFAPLGSVSST
jgi:hypothetical protein